MMMHEVSSTVSGFYKSGLKYLFVQATSFTEVGLFTKGISHYHNNHVRADENSHDYIVNPNIFFINIWARIYDNALISPHVLLRNNLT